MPGYLDEFCFRFNRRRQRSRGLVFLRTLQLAVGHDPVRYRQLVAHPTPKRDRPTRCAPDRQRLTPARSDGAAGRPAEAARPARRAEAAAGSGASRP